MLAISDASASKAKRSEFRPSLLNDEQTRCAFLLLSEAAFRASVGRFSHKLLKRAFGSADFFVSGKQLEFQWEKQGASARRLGTWRG